MTSYMHVGTALPLTSFDVLRAGQVGSGFKPDVTDNYDVLRARENSIATDVILRPKAREGRNNSSRMSYFTSQGQVDR